MKFPFRTPTIAGGLFSIDKSFFYELGLYDPGLEIRGAENMELSFKVHREHVSTFLISLLSDETEQYIGRKFIEMLGLVRCASF